MDVHELDNETRSRGNSGTQSSEKSPTSDANKLVPTTVPTITTVASTSTENTSTEHNHELPDPTDLGLQFSKSTVILSNDNTELEIVCEGDNGVKVID